MRCLVLGGGGFLGSHLCDALVARRYSVRILEKYGICKDNISHLLDKTELLEGDFTDSNCLEDAIRGIDVIFHLVSTTLPKTSNDNIVCDISTNLVPTLSLLEIARRRNVRKIIFFSSGGTVYGIPKTIPISEEHPTNPICSYGIHKLAIEKYLYLYYHSYGLDYTVLRIANPYGERQNCRGNQGAVSVFSYKAIRKDPVEIWGDGLIIRDYIYVGDVVKAAIAALNYTGDHKIYNIGSGIGLSLLDVVNGIEGILGYRLDVQFKQSRGIDVPANILDTSKAKQELAWVPEISFHDGLMKTIKYISSLI